MEKISFVGGRPGVSLALERARSPGGEAARESKEKGGNRPAAPEENREGQRPALEEVREALEQINETLRIYRTELRFVLHEESGEYMVRVINAETQEVIREIPPEWVLKIVASVKRMLGLILDKFI